MALLLILAMATPSVCDEAPPPHSAIRHFRSTHFHLLTDLPHHQAERCLRRMERVLGAAEGYWQRSMPGQVHCYVVKNLKHWPPERFPDPSAPLILNEVRGGTDWMLMPSRQGQSRQAVIYAMAESGVVEHEVVHAYCFQTFGRGGPDWYREGMAELLSQEIDRAASGQIAAETVQLLRNVPPPTIHRVTRSGELKQSVAEILAASPGQRALSPPSSTNSSTADRLARARAAYAESWALCHLLYHNRNYKQRFQMLGKHLLVGAPVSLDEAFAGRLQEIDFELAFFANRLTAGYRVDLCEWDWDRPCREPEIDQSIAVRLKACRGFQPTSIRLIPGHRYRVVTEGTWQIAASDGLIDADGDAQGRGRVEAVVLDQFRLSDPTELGTISSFTATSSGDLFLRCLDGWDDLSDNRGTIVVRLTRQQ